MRNKGVVYTSKTGTTGPCGICRDRRRWRHQFRHCAGDDGAALRIDADIRGIDEIEQALEQTRCSRVKYLFITHENFDHSSANDYYENHGAIIIASKGCLDALKDEGDDKFAEMSDGRPALFELYPGLKMRLPHIVFSDRLPVNLPGATVHLKHYDQSHSRGDATAYFAEDAYSLPSICSIQSSIP